MIVYDEPVYRPPSEAGSLIIQATIGCPHNKCEFCYLYKGKRFKRRPIADVKSDITQAALEYGNHVRTIFLADGSTIILPASELAEIIGFCYASFSGLERVTSYGSAKFILRGKTSKQMSQLRRAGLNRIHMGLESGSDAVLSMMKKGATHEEMIKAGKMVKEAGMELSVYVLLGLGGKEFTNEHAMESARALNTMNPDFIRLRTLLLRPDEPLWKRYEMGKFTPLTRLETLQETRLLLEHLECTGQFLSDHITNLVSINGSIPGDKNRMLDKLDSAILQMAGQPDDREWSVDSTGCRGL